MGFAVVVLTLALTSQEQLLVELINRARMDPEAEATRHGIQLNERLEPGTISPLSKQPLAAHQALVDSAGAHSQAMLDENFFSHTNPAGESPTDRAKQAGYEHCVGENIAWAGSCRVTKPDDHVYLRHKQLFLSPAHRKNMLTPRYREVGTGLRFGSFTSNDRERDACMVTEVFGSRGGDVYITGVVYSDTVVSDEFYSIGEGVAEVLIEATDASGQSFTATTTSAGGYSLQVPSGTYTVTASGEESSAIVAEQVIVQDINIKLDFETNQGIAVTPVFPQIIDDGDPGFSIAGAWRGTDTPGYQLDSLAAVGGSDTRASWSFEVTPGRYRVLATWPNCEAAGRATYHIYDGEKLVTSMEVDQRRAGERNKSRWLALGKSVEINGTSLIIELATSKQAGAGSEQVIADAIRIHHSKHKPPQATVDTRRVPSRRRSQSNSLPGMINGILRGN